MEPELTFHILTAILRELVITLADLPYNIGQEIQIQEPRLMPDMSIRVRQQELVVGYRFLHLLRVVFVHVQLFPSPLLSVSLQTVPMTSSRRIRRFLRRLLVHLRRSRVVPLFNLRTFRHRPLGIRLSSKLKKMVERLTISP